MQENLRPTNNQGPLLVHLKVVRFGAQLLASFNATSPFHVSYFFQLLFEPVQGPGL
jgi:hypothetical protein